MAERRVPWWLWTWVVVFSCVGVATIVATVTDGDPGWSWFPHLLQGVSLVAFAVFFYVVVGPLRRRRRAKKRSLPPL
ncbi:hypothetical protein [Streptomyces sp. NBC_00986]|uniref:hypothetical protein n=1 Tax=Streptomyces sp. NBC_00986 TaxID=2903702 RepID=UPI00386382F8|nr:hypothetical protein OG504_46490 [Streptomyces sp. NBC_00986]